MLKIVRDIIAAQEAATTPISTLRSVEYPELDALMRQFAELPAGEDHIKVITANNANACKKTFVEAYRSGRAEAPVFIYDEDLLKKMLSGYGPMVRILDAILKLRPEGDEQILLRSLFQTTVMDKLHTCGMAKGILDGDDQYTLYHMEKKYGRITDDVVDAAREEYEALKAGKVNGGAPRVFTPEEEAALKDLSFDADALSSVFYQTLDEYGFNDWTSTVSGNVTAVNVREREFDVAIPATRIVNGIKAYELTGHEVESHVRMSMNGQFLLRGLGGGAFKDESEILYEGLALVSDVGWALKFGDTTKAPIPYYVLAEDLAMMGKNFLEIYEEIFQLRVDAGASTKDKKDGSPAPVFNNAWTNAYRVMRGSTHSTAKNDLGFCQPKDRAYLEGYRIARELVEAGYGHLLDVGVVRPSSLVEIAQFVVSPNDIPYPNLGIAEKLARAAIA
jgi:hypothetical protein